MLKSLILPVVLALAPVAMAQTGSADDAPYLRTVHFEIKAPQAKAVFLSGNMTEWMPTQIALRRTGAGVFYVNTELRPGRYQYVFMVDAKPVLDEASPSEDDGKGEQHSYFLLDDDREAQPFDGPRGKVEKRVVKSKALKEKRSVNIYTPPGYSKKETYPVLFLLHGYGMDEDQWITGGVQNYIDRYIASKFLGPLIVVMPGAPNDFYTGRSEDYIVKEIYPYIARNYKIRKGKASAAIGGMSMGGFGAFHLAYRHPELFGHSMILSPGNLDQKALDQLDPELKGGKKVAASLDIRCGKGDELVFPFTERLVRILEENNVPLTYEVTRGVHDWNYWHSVMRPSLVKVEEFFKKSR